jgi:hypothetical protein
VFNATPLTFQVNNENDFVGELTVDKVTLALKTEFRIDESNSIIGVKIDLHVMLKIDESDLFSLVSLFEFEVSDLKAVLVQNEDNKMVQSQYARKLLNIAIGGSRGMLAVYLTPTKYNHFTLPIANIPKDFFDN